MGDYSRKEDDFEMPEFWEDVRFVKAAAMSASLLTVALESAEGMTRYVSFDIHDYLKSAVAWEKSDGSDDAIFERWDFYDGAMDEYRDRITAGFALDKPRDRPEPPKPFYVSSLAEPLKNDMLDAMMVSNLLSKNSLYEMIVDESHHFKGRGVVQVTGRNNGKSEARRQFIIDAMKGCLKEGKTEFRFTHYGESLPFQNGHCMPLDDGFIAVAKVTAFSSPTHGAFETVFTFHKSAMQEATDELHAKEEWYPLPPNSMGQWETCPAKTKYIATRTPHPGVSTPVTADGKRLVKLYNTHETDGMHVTLGSVAQLIRPGGHIVVTADQRSRMMVHGGRTYTVEDGPEYGITAQVSYDALKALADRTNAQKTPLGKAILDRPLGKSPTLAAPYGKRWAHSEAEDMYARWKELNPRIVELHQKMMAEVKPDGWEPDVPEKAEEMVTADQFKAARIDFSAITAALSGDGKRSKYRP